MTDAFGNPPAAPATADFVVDTVAPDIAVTAVTDDFLADVINADDLATGFNVSGTSNAEEGQLVTVMINGIDATNTGAVQADGTWSVAILPADVVGLVHSDTPDFTARVEDLAGNETTSGPLPATVNTTPPTIAVTEIGGDGFINIAEHGTDGITVEGTTNAEDGQDVEVTLTQGGTQATVTVQADGGTFSAPFPPADLAPFIDGPVTATADVTNQAGNSNSSAPFGAVVDLIAPTIAIDDPLAGDNVFTKFNEINGLDVTGTTDAEPGQTVTVTYDGMDYTGPVVDGAPGPNTFTVLIPPAAFDGVDTGDTITGITAQVEDQAGNPSAVATATDLAVDVDGPTIDINPIAGDDIINIAESEDLAGVEISGTSSGADGEEVTVNILVGGVTVFTATDTAAAVTGAWSVTIPQGVAWLVNDETFTVTADVSDFEGTPAPQATRDFSTDFNNPTIDITAVPFGAFLNALDTESAQLIEGTSDGANDREVTVTVTDDDGVVTELTTMTDAATGAWSVELGTGLLQSLAEGAATISATVTSAAGNPPLAPATEDFTVDTIPPTITINEPGFLDAGAGDIFLNAAEAAVMQTISGTAPGAEAGQQVTVTVTDSEGDLFAPLVQPTVDGAGNWTLDMDLSMLAEGAVTISATVSDQAGNPAETPATLEFTKDTIAPVVTITQVTDDFVADVINADDVANGFTVTGTTDASEAGRDVTVTITGVPGGTATGEVQPDGNWSVDMPGGLALADGTTPEFIASVTDAAGNTGDSAPVNPAVNLTVPTIAFDTLAGDDILNIAESNEATLTVSGTTTGFADGDQITLSAPGIADIMVTVTGNAFSHDIPRADVFALIEEATGAAPDLDGDGNLVSAGPGTISFTASGTNNIGNESADHSTDLELALTPPALEITDVTGAAGADLGGVLNIEERGEIVEISGTSDANGQTVTVTLSDGNGFSATATGVVVAGVWTAVFAAGDLDTLPDGTTEISLVADVTDANGNETVTDPTLFDTDFIAPDVTIDTVTSVDGPIGDFINLAEQAAGVTVTGGSDLPAGVMVTVTLTSGAFTATATGTTDADGNWSAEFEGEAGTDDLAGLLEGPVSIVAEADDAAGNTGSSAPVNVEADLTPPVIFIDAIGDEGVYDRAQGALTLTGTTDAEAGQTVTVVFEGETYTGTVTAGGGTIDAPNTWALNDPIPASVINGLDLGAAFAASATVSDLAGNPADLAATADVVPYAATDTYLLELSRVTADVLRVGIVIDPRSPLLTDEAYALGDTLVFDTTEIQYVGGASYNNAFDTLALSFTDTSDIGSGRITFAGVWVEDEFAFPDPVVAVPDPEVARVQFNLNDLSEGASVISVTLENDQGAISTTFIGTNGDDVLVAPNTDAVLQGRGGDDTIDVSAGGVNTIIFEAAPADNGVDTITGFSVAPDTALPDQIGFAGLDHSDLRGDGTDVEALATGGALGANTGFVILTTALANLDAATLEAAAAGLTGEAGGDILYLLASDGTNAALAQITFAAVDDASATIMAQFTGLGDLSGITADEILGFSAV